MKEPLKKKFGRAFSRVFSTKNGFKRNFALAVAVIGGPSWLVHEAAIPTPSAIHATMPDTGQAQRLDNELAAIIKLRSQASADAKATQAAQQQAIVTPDDRQLAARIEALAETGKASQAQYTQAAGDLRDEVLISKTISEKEAIALAGKFEKATGDALLGEDKGTLRYRDEAQYALQNVTSIRPRLEKGDAAFIAEDIGRDTVNGAMDNKFITGFAAFLFTAAFLNMLMEGDDMRLRYAKEKRSAPKPEKLHLKLSVG